MTIRGRTDMACEAPGLSRLEDMEARGIGVREELLEELELLSVEIKSPEAAKLLGKPPGRYYTLFLGERPAADRELFIRGVTAVSRLILRCLEGRRPSSVLIAALGNPDITPDAIGPLAASSILVTRHLKERAVPGFESFCSTTLFRTGVLGTTGLESARQIRALCDSLRPRLVIAVDALAGAEVGRLCRSVQICDSGISPGSGVGNDREELSRESLGVPVIAVGVPTVIDAASLCERQGTEGMFVTPRDIDSQVRGAGRLIGFGINMALHPGLSLEDMELLLG